MNARENVPRAIGFALWSLLHGILASAAFFSSDPSLKLPFLLPFVMASFELFLLFKTASYLPVASNYTKCLHGFLYDPERSALPLLTLSAVWLYGLYVLLSLSAVDLLTEGPISETLTALVKFGDETTILAFGVYVCSVPAYFSLMGWVGLTGIMAFSRFLVSTQSPQDETHDTVLRKNAELENNKPTVMMSLGKDW